MPTLAMIVPVYNEEKLLPTFINNAYPQVDELIFADGSAYGKSTDMTPEIINECNDDKIKYISGTYGMLKAWDREAQIYEALKKVESDYVCVSSVDMLYANFPQALDALSEEPDCLFGNIIEFWIDTKHIREAKKLVPHQKNAVISKKEYFEHYYFGDDIGKHTHRIAYCQNWTMFHYGWVRPFEVQIKKHVRNILTGGWGDLGLKLLQRSDNAIKAWATHHVLGYNEVNAMDYIGFVPDWQEMSCYDGLEEYVEWHQKEYKEDMYRRVMKYLPHDLLPKG